MLKKRITTGLTNLLEYGGLVVKISGFVWALLLAVYVLVYSNTLYTDYSSTSSIGVLTLRYTLLVLVILASYVFAVKLPVLSGGYEQKKKPSRQVNVKTIIELSAGLIIVYLITYVVLVLF